MAASAAYSTRIIVDPAILAGKPVVKGTRIPVALVLDHLAQELDLQELFAAYPRLTPEDVKACLAYAHALVAGEDIYLTAASSSSASAQLPWLPSGPGWSTSSVTTPPISTSFSSSATTAYASGGVGETGRYDRAGNEAYACPPRSDAPS